MNHRRFIVPAAAALLTVMVVPAHASEPSPNWSNFPGAKCVKANTAGTLRVRWARAENTSSTSSLRVSCPIDRQNVLGNIGGGTQVWVIDDHPTQNVTCSLVVRRASTDTEVSREDQSTGIFQNSPNPVLLSFGAATSGSDDVYVISCLIPPSTGGVSSVVGIRVVEVN